MNIIATEKAPGAIGPYSQGYEVNGMVFTSGQIPVDPATGTVAGTAIAEQAEQSCKNVGAVLAAGGASYEQVITAIQAGFTSVMIDASSQPYEGNVATCQKVVEAAHAVNVSVEGELGTIGNTDSVETTAPDEILYTDPEQAKDFIEKTGIDCLAVAIGTCHGIYPKDKKPELRIDILDEIKKIVPPEEGSDLCHRFVMHGRAVCNARKPECEKCCLNDICRYAREQSGADTAQ
mgnify:CR=1 FL=1